MTDWTPQMIARLKTLWADPDKTITIIGEEMGISRSAVSGARRRYKLPERGNPIKPVGSGQYHRGKRVRAATAFGGHVRVNKNRTPRSADRPERVHGPKIENQQSLMEGRIKHYAAMGTNGHACSFPVGDPGEPGYHACGAPAVNLKPYCPQHCASAFVAIRRPSDRQAETP